MIRCVTPPERPAPGDREILAGLPRTRPQRRSTRRADAPSPAQPAKATEPAAPVAGPATTRKPKAPNAKAPKTKAPKAKESTARAAAMQPLLDHPAPADIPGAPFAPPPPRTPSDAREQDAAAGSQGRDVVSVAVRLAGDVAHAGVGVARLILRRLPRP